MRATISFDFAVMGGRTVNVADAREILLHWLHDLTNTKLEVFEVNTGEHMANIVIDHEDLTVEVKE